MVVYPCRRAGPGTTTSATRGLREVIMTTVVRAQPVVAVSGNPPTWALLTGHVQPSPVGRWRRMVARRMLGYGLLAARIAEMSGAVGWETRPGHCIVACRRLPT